VQTTKASGLTASVPAEIETSEVFLLTVYSIIKEMLPVMLWSRDNVASIATGHGLNDRGVIV
jgi:hypothetical protein